MFLRVYKSFVKTKKEMVKKYRKKLQGEFGRMKVNLNLKKREGLIFRALHSTIIEKIETTDASHTELGETFWRKWKGDYLKLVAFSSSYENGSGEWNATKEFELLGVVWALEHSRHFVSGKQENISTEHQPPQESQQKNPVKNIQWTANHTVGKNVNV